MVDFGTYRYKCGMPNRIYASSPRIIEFVKNIRLMLVEHNIQLSEEITRVLSGQGHIVAAYSSADDALADLNEFTPDLVILDLNQPEENENFLSRLREVSSVEVVVIGDSEQGDDVQMMRSLGVSHYLVRKWVNASQLKHILKHLRLVA